jgi:hypothetical protein
MDFFENEDKKSVLTNGVKKTNNWIFLKRKIYKKGFFLFTIKFPNFYLPFRGLTFIDHLFIYKWEP